MRQAVSCCGLKNECLNPAVHLLSRKMKAVESSWKHHHWPTARNSPCDDSFACKHRSVNRRLSKELCRTLWMSLQQRMLCTTKQHPVSLWPFIQCLRWGTVFIYWRVSRQEQLVMMMVMQKGLNKFCVRLCVDERATIAHIKPHVWWQFEILTRSSKYFNLMS